MKRDSCVLIIASAVGIALTLFVPPESSAGHSSFNLSIGINSPAVVPAPVPPPLVIASPPPVVAIPGTYVYAAPTVSADIFFFNGYWYRPYDGYWYRARYYRGPWGYVAPAYVPGAVVNVTNYGYRHVPRERYIPYGQFKKNWRNWEHKKHWDRHSH